MCDNVRSKDIKQSKREVLVFIPCIISGVILFLDLLAVVEVLLKALL